MLFYLIEFILGMIGVGLIALLGMIWVAWQFREESTKPTGVSPEPVTRSPIQSKILADMHQAKLAGFD